MNRYYVNYKAYRFLVLVFFHIVEKWHQPSTTHLLLSQSKSRSTFMIRKGIMACFLLNSKLSFSKVDVPEWLSGMTRNHVGFARAGSNPAVHVFHLCL